LPGRLPDIEALVQPCLNLGTEAILGPLKRPIRGTSDDKSKQVLGHGSRLGLAALAEHSPPGHASRQVRIREGCDWPRAKGGEDGGPESRPESGSDHDEGALLTGDRSKQITLTFRLLGQQTEVEEAAGRKPGDDKGRDR
jgi:hypothetical protein